jgi:Ribbon-helix-helix protein, copG family
VHAPREVPVSDILIRDVPDDIVEAIDRRARGLGLSRSEYLRRQLAHEAVEAHRVTREDLLGFGEAFADLADPDVMGEAWR